MSNEIQGTGDEYMSNEIQGTGDEYMSNEIQGLSGDHAYNSIEIKERMGLDELVIVKISIGALN